MIFIDFYSVLLSDLIMKENYNPQVQSGLVFLLIVVAIALLLIAFAHTSLLASVVLAICTTSILYLLYNPFKASHSTVPRASRSTAFSRVVSVPREDRPKVPTAEINLQNKPSHMLFIKSEEKCIKKFNEMIQRNEAFCYEGFPALFYAYEMSFGLAQSPDNWAVVIQHMQGSPVYMNHTDEKGNTVLHYLVQFHAARNYAKCLQAVKSIGGRFIDVRNEDGKTPLDIFAQEARTIADEAYIDEMNRVLSPAPTGAMVVSSSDPV